MSKMFPVSDLHPKQLIAHTTSANEILFGGAAGGGKSYLMRWFALWCAIHCPGIQIYLFRRTHPDLTKNHMQGPTSLPVVLAPLIGLKLVDINYGKGIVSFANGSRIFLCHCQYEKDVTSYQGSEIHLLLIDELTHFTETIYRFLRGRCRLGSWKPPIELEGMFPRIFNGSNPGGIGHCVPYGEVLTPHKGWVDIKSMEIGDAVYTVNSNGEMIESVVSQVHKGKSSEIIDAESRGLTMSCTPEHEVAKIGGTKKERNSLFTLTPFKDLPGQANILRSVKWRGVPICSFEPKIHQTRKRKLDQPKSITGKQYSELMGWYLSEGSTNDRDKAFSISQTKVDQRSKISNLLDDCGFKQSWSFNQVIVHAPDWWSYLRRFGKCREKRVPLRILNSDTECLRAFFDAIIDGDGHWVKGKTSGQFYTTSIQLADDVQNIALKLGYVVFMSNRQRDNRDGLSYCVSFKVTKNGGSELLTGNHLYNVNTETKRRSTITKKHGEFDVYCIGVENTHSFIIRQRGSVWVSGNSWVKQMFVTAFAPLKIWKAPKDEGGMLRQFIPARLEDNPTMMENDPDYKDRLSGLGDPALVKAMLTGDWDIVSGGALDDVWDREKHMIEPFDVPKDWHVDRSFDWGSTAPFSVGWWARSNGEDVKLKNGLWRYFPANSIIRINEWYGWNGKANQGCKMLAKDIAKGVLIREKAMGLRVHPGPADSAIYTNQNGNCIADDMAAEGVRWVAADKGPGSRVNGLEKVRGMLAEAKKDMPEKPGLWAFNHCLHYSRTMPVLPRDEAKRDDVDSKSEDHTYDEVRYRATTPVRITTSQEV